MTNTSNDANPYYYYVGYIKATQEIYTHGKFYNCNGGSVFDDTELRNLIGTKADLSALESLISEVEENELVTAAALTELHENKADKSEIPDVSEFATNTDLNTKQDLLVSGTNIKTVNGNSILGSGNIETPDTKVTSAANHYGYNSDNATSTTGAFVTKITKDAANHVTSFESRALTSTDIPGLDASKITSGTIDIARLPKGALEQLHHYETKKLAQQAVIDKAVQLGDTVQINHATMYICTNDNATTFATQFTEYVAGTAASVPWSGITGKPTGIDEWGNRIGVIESGYATQSWVGENYLPLTGGTLSGTGTVLTIDRTDSSPLVGFNKNGNRLGWLGFNTSYEPIAQVIVDGAGVQKTLLHEGNYSDYALPITGGTLSGTTSIPLYIKSSHATEAAIGLGANNANGYGYIVYKGGDSWAVTKEQWGAEYSILHSGNFSNYALPITGGTINGNITANNIVASSVLGVNNINGKYSFMVVPSGDNTYIEAAKNDGTSNKGNIIFSGLNAENLNSLKILSDSVTSNGNITAPKFIGNLTGDTANIGTLQIITNEINGANGTGNAHINYSSTGKVTIANGGGNVAIGGTTADAKLHVHGDVKATGNMYATDFCTTSDNRLKDFTKDVIIDFNELKNIPKKYYYWKDKSMGEELQIGTSAQELAKVYPECVSYNEKEDRYSVSYQKLSIIALAAIDKLHERISVLEKKLND